MFLQQLRNILCFTLYFCLFITSVQAGQKGVIVARPLGSIDITIDGDFSDWPLDAFEQISEQPLFPLARDSESTDARGDYVVYDPERVGFFNFPRGAVSEDDPNTDFEVSTYFAYDEDFIYILAIFIDDEIEDSLDETPFGSRPYLNDGIEFFFDAKNDSIGCEFRNEIPSVEIDEPRLSVFQISTGLNFFEEPVLPEDEGGLGAIQGIERTENQELNFLTEKFADGTYRDTLNAVDGPNIAAKRYEDLRAAGAPNPAIAENPNLEFSGYAMEMIIPFGVVEGFTPDEPIGFDVFWRDVDQSSGGDIQFIDWIQTTTAGSNCPNESTNIWDGTLWGAMEFNKDNPLDGTSVKQWKIHNSSR